MTIVSLKLNNAGHRRLRTCPGAKRLVMTAATKIAAASGAGNEAQDAPGRNRARAIGGPDTDAARKDAATNLTPLRKLGAAR